MFQTESEAWLEASKIAKSENLNLDSDPYIPIYNQKKQGWVLYPRVATLEVKAMRSGTYLSKDACIFNHDDTGKLVSASTFVYRDLLDNTSRFSSDEVYLEEYATKKWHHDKPHMFLAKIALSRALRHAFPDLFGAQITYEEAKCELEFDNRSSNEKSKIINQKIKNEESVNTLSTNNTNIVDLVGQVFGNK
jgi:hypothetical protein